MASSDTDERSPSSRSLSVSSDLSSPPSMQIPHEFHSDSALFDDDRPYASLPSSLHGHAHSHRTVDAAHATPALAKIFWPLGTLPCKADTENQGAFYLVGWNLRGFLVCIAGFVPVDRVPIRSMDAIMERWQESTAAKEPRYHPILTRMNRACQVAPCLLGIVEREPGYFEKHAENNDDLRKRKDVADIWLVLSQRAGQLPTLKSIHCCGYRYPNVSSEFVFYDPPNPFYLQFMTMEPLNLDISANDAFSKTAANSIARKDRVASLAESATAPQSHLHRKMVLHTRLGMRSRKKQIHDMHTMLQQVPGNLRPGYQIVQRFLRDLPDYQPDVKLRWNVDRVRWFLSAWLLPIFQYVWSWLKPVGVYPALAIFMALRWIAELILVCLNWRFWPGQKLALKDVSSVCQQIDLRLQQGCFWPWQWMLFRRLGWRYKVSNRAQYISFYNSMWLVINDLIIGFAIGSLLLEHGEYVAATITEWTEFYTVDVIKSAIKWLMGWPAGLKLNSPLDNFLGKLFLQLIEVWSTACMLPLKPMLRVGVRMAGYAGFFGACMVFSILSDFLNAISLHIFIFYRMNARLYHWQLGVLWSLFNLFRGKKYNVLRNRLDSCDYDLDQLLLGTIFFTLLFFLVPTVIVYYLLFVFARIFVVILQIVLITILAVLNHFPLFGLMLRFKDARRLPGGISLEPCTADFLEQFQRARWWNWTRTRNTRESIGAHVQTQFSYLHLKNVPIPFSSIYFQYMLLWKRLTSHYMSLYVIRSLIVGTPMKPLPILQYPMLPPIRPSPATFWIFLKDSFGISPAAATPNTNNKQHEE